MATRANPNVAKKEKKVTPSLNSRSPRNKPTNNAIGGASAVTNKVKTTTSLPSSPSSKSFPNYLRPTSSSTKPDSLTPTKKTINDDLTQNAARRRSFDRPPSAIRNQKSLISPDPKGRVISGERQLPSRSSSFSHSSSPKVPASPKHVLERNCKSFKPIKSPQSSSFGWRSSSFSKTTGSLKSGSNVIPTNSTKPSPIENVEENKLQLETKESPIQENNNVETEEDHMQNVEIKEATVTDSLQGTDNIEDETVSEDNSANTSNNSTQNLDPIEGTSPRQVLDENHEDEINHTIEKEEKGESRHSDIQPEEGIADETETVGEGYENAKAIEHPLSAEELEDEKKNEEMQVESKEVEEGIAKAEEKEAKNGVQKGQGKRESPAAYNDVIEETKNKLLQNRKNKVKALVGAFETVIDFEAAAGSNSNK